MRHRCERTWRRLDLCARGPERTRAITELPTSGSTQYGDWDPSDPVVLEMQKSLLGGAEKSVQTLRELNRQIRGFCDICAEYVGSRKQLPKTVFGKPSLDSPLGKPVFDFTSSEEYAFFALLSIVVQRVQESIFLPFHPIANMADNDFYADLYKKKTDTGRSLL